MVVLGSGIFVRETDISGRFLVLKIFGYLYWGCGGKPGGDDGVADGLADGDEEVADGLALADGIAMGGLLADGVAIGEGLADGDALEDDVEDFGVDGELSLSSSELSENVELFSRREHSLTPATDSQSTALLRSKMTFARKWKDPDASPS